MCPPKELFFVVVTIKPARANNETDRIISDTRISINVKPSDFVKYFKTTPP
jgi:hypothetical protein